MAEFVTGDKALAEAFKQLPKQIADKMMRKSAREVAKQDVLPLAQRLVPVDTEALHDSLVVRAAKKLRKGTVGASVMTREGMFQGDEFYGGMQEFGFTQRDGNHNEGNPFLRPALYEDRQRKLKTFARASRDQFQPIVVDVRKRSLRKERAKARQFLKSL